MRNEKGEKKKKPTLACYLYKKLADHHNEDCDMHKKEGREKKRVTE